MRKALLIAVALMATITPACGPVLVIPSPRTTINGAVPISQEHHHHLIIENSYLKAYEVEVPAHESTLLHQHDFDYVYVVLGGAQVTNTVVDKLEVRMYLPDTTVNFSKGPFAHVAGNVGDTPFRNITISLLHHQGEVKTYYPSVDAALSPLAGQTTNQTDKSAGLTKVMMLETDEVRVFAALLEPAGNWSSSETHARFVVLLDRMKDTTGPREKNAPTFPAGLLKWIPEGQSWAFNNDTQYEKRFVMLEFKD
jgi:hypothetical protein